MIKILVEKKEDRIVFVEVKGHANSAECGKDLVCAAVSGVVQGTITNIQNDNDFDYVVDEGYFSIRDKGNSTSHDQIVLETLVSSLNYLAENNTKFIKIKNN